MPASIAVNSRWKELRISRFSYGAHCWSHAAYEEIFPSVTVAIDGVSACCDRTQNGPSATNPYVKEKIMPVVLDV